LPFFVLFLLLTRCSSRSYHGLSFIRLLFKPLDPSLAAFHTHYYGFRSIVRLFFKHYAVGSDLFDNYVFTNGVPRLNHLQFAISSFYDRFCILWGDLDELDLV